MTMVAVSVRTTRTFCQSTFGSLEMSTYIRRPGPSFAAATLACNATPDVPAGGNIRDAISDKTGALQEILIRTRRQGGCHARCQVQMHHGRGIALRRPSIHSSPFVMQIGKCSRCSQPALASSGGWRSGGRPEATEALRPCGLAPRWWAPHWAPRAPAQCAADASSYPPSRQLDYFIRFGMSPVSKMISDQRRNSPDCCLTLCRQVCVGKDCRARAIAGTALESVCMRFVQLECLNNFRTYLKMKDVAPFQQSQLLCACSNCAQGRDPISIGLHLTEQAFQPQQRRAIQRWQRVNGRWRRSICAGESTGVPDLWYSD